MRSIRAVLVDDEPLANAGLRVLLGAHRDIEVVGEATTGAAASRLVLDQRPDLLFLDVQMPDGDGFAALDRVLRGLPPGVHPPEIIFVTAYDRYALRAFEVRALDYLLKPVDDRRFREALDRVRQRLATRAPDPEALLQQLRDFLETRTGGGERLMVTVGSRTIALPFETIDWIGARDYCVEVHAAGRSYVLRESLATLERRLGPRSFLRVHRSAIVNLARVSEVRRGPVAGMTLVLAEGSRIPVSRSRRALVRARVGRGA